MADHMAIWLFWFCAVAVGYGAISASIRYIHHWRRGSRIMAAQAALQAVLCTAGLGTVWAIYRTYISG
jgi:hypothetical protein